MEIRNTTLIDTVLLEKKFNSIADRYLSDNKTINDNIELKREHTFKVCSEIKGIVTDLNLNDEDRELAYTIALFHDIGRFEQFFRFKTFNDKISVNHAELAVKILKEEGFLENIPPSWHDIVFTAILNHNIPAIQIAENERQIFFSKLIRDADKLDIWRVIADIELRRVVEGSSLENGYSVPAPIVERFIQNRFVPLDMASSTNDMRLVRVSWVFDLNFQHSFREVKKRGLLNQILSLVPPSDEITQIQTIIRNFLDEKTR
ncbi:MAG: HD domain-containing protein [Bacteroidales bacterium]|nr:HD domain-containing protein [Bacteroidales bacterium]